VITVWGDAIAPHGGRVWLSGLIELLAPFGISERLARTSVYRLTQEGWLSAHSKGRRSEYRLTAEGLQRFEEAHQRIYAPPIHDWDGSWDLVAAPSGELSTSQRSSLRRELGWQGFGELTPHVMVRPAYAGTRDIAGLLRSLSADSGVTVVRAHDVACGAQADFRSLASRVKALWDLARVAAEYRAFSRRFGPLIDVLSRDTGHGLNGEQCFAVRTLLIHAFRRVSLHDPHLPRELLPDRWPGAGAYDLCASLYRLSQGGAETHLASTLDKHGAMLAPAEPGFYARFGGITAEAPVRTQKLPRNP
jgi:phenylacetic acid degradation operon negative regulatory protein